MSAPQVILGRLAYRVEISQFTDVQLKMCLQRLKRVRNNARLFHLVGNGIGTVRLIVSSHQVQKFVQTVSHVYEFGTELVRHDLHDSSRARRFRTSSTTVCKL